MKPLVVGSFFAAAMAVLLWAGWMSASIPVVKVRDLRGMAYAETIRVDDSKISHIESLAPLRFQVIPEGDPAQFVWVESPGSVPENFKLGGSVGLRGKYSAEKNVFIADEITTQCPSRYEASKEAASEKGGGGYPTSLKAVPEAPATTPATTPATNARPAAVE